MKRRRSKPVDELYHDTEVVDVVEGRSNRERRRLAGQKQVVVERRKQARALRLGLSQDRLSSSVATSRSVRVASYQPSVDAMSTSTR